LAEVGQFEDELSAYLWFDYIRGRPAVDSSQVLLSTKPEAFPPYRIYLLVPNDALSAIPYLSGLKAQGAIQGYDLVFSNSEYVAYSRNQTRMFKAAYYKPVKQKLETLPREQLLTSVSRFLLFKSRTDGRVRAPENQISSLESHEATDLAADIIAISRFYDLPMDVFLGVGAMENNYLNVRGDLDHAIWKRKPAKGDIVLKRRRGKVLVANYSIGVWQITRETLRYAHSLYLNDFRDYCELPERLRPPRSLQFDLSDSHVLTTYAGLLLRDLIDRFNGDINQAVGAYNGGPKNPNLQYAAGVDMVAQYARNVLAGVARVNEEAVSAATLPAAPLEQTHPAALAEDQALSSKDRPPNPE
jgi:hypothetical protein